MPSRRTRVVIVGAGFAGTLTARRLAEKRESFDVTLVNPDNQFLFTPRLIDALAAQDDQPIRACTADLQDIAERDSFQFMTGSATNIDRTTRTISINTADGGTERVPYDIAIITPGATTNYYGIPGAETFGLPLKTLEHVRAIHDAIRGSVERAANAATDDERRRALALVIVGGGLSGVETASALNGFMRAEIQRRNASLLPFATCSVIQAGPQILNGFHHQLVAGVRRELERQGVAVHTGSPVAEITEHSLRTTTGEVMPSGVLIWCAGVKPNVIPMTPEAGRDGQGCLMVDAELRVDDHLASAGDVIAFRHKNVGIPKNAQTALRMGRHLAKHICRTETLKHLQPFTYISLGTIVLLGETGFLEVFGICIKTSLIKWLRDFFYRIRYIEAVGQMKE